MYSEIASNKRRSVILVIVFFVVWLAIGAAVGYLFGHFSRSNVTPGYSTGYDWGPVITGMVIGGLLALLGILYSLTSGANMVLRTSGAVPADPTQYQQLHNLVETLAIGDGIPKPAVYIINDPSPNAFATGMSPQKASITFTSGILATMNREELEGVTSHEMSHIKNHDIRLLLIVGTLIGMAALLASIIWRLRFSVEVVAAEGTMVNSSSSSSLQDCCLQSSGSSSVRLFAWRSLGAVSRWPT